MTINTRRLLFLSATLLANAVAADQDDSNTEIVVLSPFQIVAKSLEMEAHYSTHQGKKMLQYIRVKSVAKGSMAERVGLKNGDHIVAIGGWRLEGQELTALNQDFPTKIQDGETTLTLTVRRPHHDDEHDVTLRYPPKTRSPKESDQTPAAPNGPGSS